MQKLTSILTALLLTTALVACGKNNDKPAEGTPVGRSNGQQETAPPGTAPVAPVAPTPPAVAGPATPAAGDAPAMVEAKQLFGTVCAACHGTNGMGDGPAAASLTPKPRAYSDMEWQKATTDEGIANIILVGGAAAGKSPMMPAQAQLKDKPEVVAALVQIIRAYGKK